MNTWIIIAIVVVVAVILITAMIFINRRDKFCVGRVCCDENMISGVTESSGACHPSDDQLVTVLNGGMLPLGRSSPKNVGALLTVGVEDDYLLARAR
jgi:hypothetical protein